MLGREALEELDCELSARCRGEAALRLRLGQLLEVLGRGGHFELGFSSLGAYSLERCCRGVRWVEGARCLARRLESLPVLRAALVRGELSWSLAEPLARVATPESEGAWLAIASQGTVRQVQALVRAALAEERDGTAADAGHTALAPSGDAACDAGMAPPTEPAEQPRTLTLSMDREEAWLLEATRHLLDALGTRTPYEQVEALLAEGQEELLAALPRGEIALDGSGEAERGREKQRLWEEQLARWRDEAEALCESRIARAVLGRDARRIEESKESDHSKEHNDGEAYNDGEERGAAGLSLHERVAREAAAGLASIESMRPAELDASIVELGEALARHELELSMGLLRFHEADGFRRLGYATETQYARERLGLSRSSLQARRALARRLGELPELSSALGRGELGVEAAVLLSAVATRSTEAAWLERARRRTVKHLREEVVAAQTAVRVSGELDCPPPLDEELEGFHALERAVLGGGPREATPCGNGMRCNGMRCDDPREADMPCDGAGVEQREARSRETAAAGFSKRRPWRVMLESLGEWLTSTSLFAGSAGSAGLVEAAESLAGGEPVAGVQLSAATTLAVPAPEERSRDRSLRARGRVVVRLRVTAELRAWWRELDSKARRFLPRGVSWVRFACESVWRGWRHLLGLDVAYGGIYLRDRCRCSSPACTRRDVTPHHLRFRSAGGGDEPENLVAVCSWCHLHGIHEGRIRARGSATRVRWELGRGSPCLVVEGRERVA